MALELHLQKPCSRRWQEVAIKIQEVEKRLLCLCLSWRGHGDWWKYGQECVEQECEVPGWGWKKLRRTWDSLPLQPWDGRSNPNMRLLPLPAWKIETEPWAWCEAEWRKSVLNCLVLLFITCSNNFVNNWLNVINNVIKWILKSLSFTYTGN